MKVELNDNDVVTLTKCMDVAAKKRGVQVASHIAAVVSMIGREESKNVVELPGDQEFKLLLSYLDDGVREFGIQEVTSITQVLLKVAQAAQNQKTETKDDELVLPEVPEIAKAAASVGDSRTADS